MRARAVTRPLRAVAGIARTTHRVVVALPAVVEAVLVLPDILTELRRVQADTTWLPLIHEELVRTAGAVEEVERNTLAVERLAEVALPLQGAALRVGRFADRLPRRRPAGEPAAE